MEVYLTIDEYMDTFFNLFIAIGSIGTMVVAICAYKYGQKYLENHKRMAQIDRNSSYAQDIIRYLFKIESICQLIFNNPGVFASAAYMRGKNHDDTPDELHDIYGKLAIINHRIDEHRNEVKNLFEEILVLSELIKVEKNQDHQVKKYAENLKWSYFILSNKIVSNLEEIQQVSLFELQQQNIDEMGLKIRIHQIKKGFKGYCPISYQNTGFKEIEDFKTAWNSFKEYLIDKHLP